MKGTIRGTNLYDVYTGENQKEIRFDNGDVYRIKGTNLYDVYTGRNQLKIEKVKDGNANKDIDLSRESILGALLGIIAGGALFVGFCALMFWILICIS